MISILVKSFKKQNFPGCVQQITLNYLQSKAVKGNLQQTKLFPLKLSWETRKKIWAILNERLIAPAISWFQFFFFTLRPNWILHQFWYFFNFKHAKEHLQTTNNSNYPTTNSVIRESSACFRRSPGMWRKSLCCQDVDESLDPSEVVQSKVAGDHEAFPFPYRIHASVEREWEETNELLIKMSPKNHSRWPSLYLQK